MGKELKCFILQARLKEETIQNLVKDDVGLINAENLMFLSISIRMIGKLKECIHTHFFNVSK